MNISQRVQYKKPIFDDYYPQQNNYMSQLSKSVSPITNNASTNFYSSSLQQTSYNSLTQSRQKERIFQQKKIPISIQKNTLFDLKSQKQSNSNIYSDIRVSEFDKPIHFQTDQLIQRPITQEQKPKIYEQKNQEFAPILEEKNDRFIKIGVIIIIVLLLLIGILKFK